MLKRPAFKVGTETVGHGHPWPPIVIKLVGISETDTPGALFAVGDSFDIRL